MNTIAITQDSHGPLRLGSGLRGVIKVLPDNLDGFVADLEASLNTQDRVARWARIIAARDKHITLHGLARFRQLGGTIHFIRWTANAVRAGL